MQRLSQIAVRKMTPRIAAPNKGRLGGMHQKKMQMRVFSSAASSSDNLSTKNHTLQAWDVPKWDCHGDYRQEAWLEDPTKPLYEKQLELPRLPVPTIKETLERFLPTAMPLAETPEEAASLQACVDSFESESSHLQERLLQRQGEFSTETNSSWLQHWWNTLGYLQVRDRSPINVSYFFQLQDDPTCFVGDKDPQVKRGAAILWHMADYRYRVCSGQMPQETLGKKKIPLCSTAFKYMFHACRIPHKDEDSYTIYDPSRHTHAIVAHKGHFFAVDFLDQQGNLVSVSVLEHRLQQCMDMAAKAGPPTLELGWMTAANRNEWAVGRQALLDAGGVVMEQALEKLQSGAMLLCLDDETPVSRMECSHLWLHGMNPTDGHTKPCNRWFDKSIQIIVTRNGKTGLLGEHTMMDGMPMVGFAEYVAKNSHEDAVRGSSNATANGEGVENIFQSAIPAVAGSANVREHLEAAKQDFTSFVQAHTIEVQSFQGYGSDFIKKAGFSPDAYVQIAMQLATYRLWGRQGGTYEATQTRTFLHGRTETTRTVSPASAAFCEIMGLVPKYDEHIESIRKKKLEILHEAVQTHVKFMGKAAAGQGVDRHFLGLSMCAQEGESLPALYSHPVFARSKRWRVSTSNLTHPLFVNWGYGEVVPDGLGLSYSVHPRFCMFNVTSLKEHEWSTKACQLLEEALLEMRALVEMDQATTVRSKL